nr:hypothetical protein [Tanacetum cinerariifolium]
ERDDIIEVTQLSLILDKTTKVYEEQQNVVAVEKKILKEDVEKLVEGEDESDEDDFADTILLIDEDSGKKYVLSLHKIHVTLFPEEDLEEKMIRWVRRVFKTFNEEAWFSIQYWKDSWHKRMYTIKHIKARNDPKEVFFDFMIFEVVTITTEQQYRLDFTQEIIVMRDNDKPYRFFDADFKYLNKNDIEDMYYLCLNNKVNYRENKLLNSLHTFI